jgi:DnaK suppressor protein
MNDKSATSDKAFLERQRQRLLQLQRELSGTTATGEAEEGGLREQALGEAGEAEDDAQKLSLLEDDGALVRRNLERQPQISRALAKIAEGSYGLSDVSGKPIPRARLEALPDALCTADEEAKRESGR